MARYRVSLPQPEAKRMRRAKVVTIWWGGGYGGETHGRNEYQVPADVWSLEFVVPDGYADQRNTSIIDGFTFNANVEYANESGTRKQNMALVPERIGA